MTTENTTPETEVKNPAALVAKNRELLETVASLKGELQAARQALEAQTQRADIMGSELHEMRVLRPWRAAIADLVGGGTARVMERCLSDLVQVVPGEDGTPALLAKDGNRLEIKGRPVPVSSDGLFELIHHWAEDGQDDLRPLLPRATGGGATGNSGRGYRYAAPKPEPKPETSRANPAYGLR